MTDNHATNIKRVRKDIGPAVLNFCRGVWTELDPPRFFMDELTLAVKDIATVAPDSPGRILRLLRKEKVIDYKVVSRRDSLYEITAVKGA